jgi:hypothetical protein
MVSTEFAASDDRNVNGVYKFDSGVIWIGLIAGSIGLLLCVGLGIAAATQGSKSAVLCLPISLLLVAFLAHIGRLAGRSLQVGDDGVAVRDSRVSPVAKPNDEDDRQETETTIKGKKRVMSQESNPRQYTEERTTGRSQDGHAWFRLVHAPIIRRIRVNH